MQLTRAARPRHPQVRRAFARVFALVVFALCAPARAQVGVDLGSTVFHEQGGPLHMTVIVPTVRTRVDIAEPVSVSASWTADVVSGASVAVVDAPAEDVDAISSATVQDTRHAFAGGITLRDEDSALDVSVLHAFENDYLSTGFGVGARTDLFERNTTLAISYARGFDTVCDVAGSFESVDKPRMSSSEGCFEDDGTRQERDLALHTFVGSWTQAWTPVLSMQLGATAQLLHGFQANPYRAVRIGRTAAQEHHPQDRARYALSAGLRLWIVPLSGTLSTYARAYRDTWDLTSLTGELAYEQTFPGGVRLRGRGRYYKQTGVSFYSDDYLRAPRGRYFTGDRELSPMHSLMIGMHASWSPESGDDGTILGFLSGFTLTLKGDVLQTFFDDFHYDAAEVPNTLALIGSIEVGAAF